MSQYIVTTPNNPMYNGKTCGVRFQAGRAFVSEHTIDPNLKLSVEQVIERMQKDFGYVVEPVSQVPASLPVVEPVIAETTPASKKRLPASA